MWKRMFVKKAALALLAAVVALSWTTTGETQGVCVVERGIDPLDVIKQNIKHNVFIGLDNSSSMSALVPGDPLGRDRQDVAKDVLEIVINGVGDAVNWGFFYTAAQEDDWQDSPNLCNVPQQLNSDGSLLIGGSGDNCEGLDTDRVFPVACGESDTMETILAKLKPKSEGGIGHNRGTSNAPSLDQIANFIANGYMGPSRPAGQKNIIIYISDGAEDCVCKEDPNDNSSTLPDFIELPPGLPGYEPSPTASSAVVRVDATSGSPVLETISTFGSSSRFRGTYNAGIMARHALARIDPNLDGTDGDIFIGYIFDPNVIARKAANHWSWQASGYGWTGRPECPPEGGFGCSRPAFISDTAEQLAENLTNVLAQIGVPQTTVSVGTSVVGSVKELIPEIPGLQVKDPDTGTVRGVTADDILGDVTTPDLQDVTFARRLRSSLRNNVLFTSSFDLPGFKGHLRAFNVYAVQNFENGAASATRTPDLQTDFFVSRYSDRNCEDPDNPGQGLPGCFWDAGIGLQNRHPDDRTILFSLGGDTAGSTPLEFNTNGVTVGGTIPLDDFADKLGVGVGYLSNLDGSGALTKADAAEIVIKVIRGWRLSIDPSTGTIYTAAGDLNFSAFEADGVTGTWKLGDSTNVGAAVVLNPPRSADADPPAHHDFEYGSNNFPVGYYWERLNRQTVVYLPTSGGTIHGFRGDNGAELFAYIPADALGDYQAGETSASRTTLKDLVKVRVANSNTPLNHPYFLAASASVEDVFLKGANGGAGDDLWHTTLVFGRGRGGKFLTGLDVSNMPDWDGSSTNVYDRLDVTNPLVLPRLLFNVGNRHGIDDGDLDGLGETWSIPVIGNVKTSTDDQWVLFAGGGYGCVDGGEDGGEGQYLFALRMEDGSVYYRSPRIPSDATSTIYNGLVATPTLYNPHQLDFQDNVDYTTRAYIGDLHGQIHKLNCADPDPANWTFTEPSATAFYDLGADQPITVPVALFRSNTDVFVFAGTGGDSRVQATAFQFAGIKDENNAANGTELFPPRLLPTGYRVYAAPVVGGESAFFAATRPEFDEELCGYRFFSLLFGVSVRTGLGTFDLDPSGDGTPESLDLGEGKVTGLFFRDEHLYVSQSGGIAADGGTLVLGEGGSTKLSDVSSDVTGNVQILVRGFRMSPF